MQLELVGLMIQRVFIRGFDNARTFFTGFPGLCPLQGKTEHKKAKYESSISTVLVFSQYSGD
jgi:hypothetical protein